MAVDPDGSVSGTEQLVGGLIQENDRYEMGYNPEEYDPHDDPRYDPRYMDDEYLMEMDAAAHGDGIGEEDGEDNDEDDSEDSDGDDEESISHDQHIAHSKYQGFAAGR